MGVCPMAFDPGDDTILTQCCEWCGQVIETADQDCPALDDGRCQP
jgi:hypothetical protein